MLFHEVASLALVHRAKTKHYKNARSFERWKSLLRMHILPVLAEYDIAAIDSDAVVTVLAPLWETHTPTAQMCRAVIEYIIDYAIHKHYRDAASFNPANWKDSLSFDLSVPAEVHTVVPREAITTGEAQRIMPTLAHGTICQRCLAFGILTVGRASEFRNARWSEIDFDSRMFYIPVNRCKVRRTEPFPVPLSLQAVEVLKSMEHKSEFVFDSRGSAPCVYSLQRNLQRAVPEHKNITTHGCRATFSSWCAETGKDPAVREACLMHVDGSKVSRAYNRSEMLDRRRLLMQEWADAVYHA